MAKKVLNKELGHEQFHSAVDWALTAEERETIKNSFTTDELVEQASKYYAGNPEQRAEAISALNDPNNPNHAEYRSTVAEEKIRADGQTLLDGENSEELLAEISGDEVKRSFYEKYLKRAARIYRKKLNRTGNPQYAAALKRITNVVRDMRLGYIPTQHSHGGIFSLDKPYASIQMLESIFRSLEPMAEGYEDIANDIDAASLDIDEDVATITGDEGIDLTTLTEGESDSVNFSQFGFSSPETSLAQFKAEAIRVKGMTKAGVTVGTRSPSSTGIKSVSEGGTNPTNRITLEDAAKSPNAFLKNALILTQYPSVRGILSRMLKDPSMVAIIKKEKNFTPAQWSDVVDRINRAFSEEVSATFNAPDIFKTSEEYTTATEAREAAIKAVNAEIDKLFFSTAPDGKKEYVTWLFKQIGFTGRGHATPEKQDSSSVKAIRDALSSMTEGIAISKTTYPLFTEGYTPPPKTKKWTPSIKDLKEIVKGIRAYEAARSITDANNATTTAKKKTMSGEIEKLSPLILDERSAGVIYDALLTVGRTNLKVLYDIFPKDIVEVARLWYDGANIIARQLSGDTAAQDVGGVKAESVQPLFGPNGRGLVAKRFGERVLEKASAILAVFSPQKDWLMNVSLAHRAMQVMYDGFTNPSGMVWDDRIAARFLARAGQPEIIEEEDGKVKYTGRAVPVVDEAGMPILDSNGLQTFTNWNAKRAKKATTQAAKINVALKGKTFEQIGVMKLIYSYEDENGKTITKELDGVALQARFIRMYSEVHHPTDFPVVTPTGEFKGKSLSPKTGAPLKLAWGGYVTIEKAIRIYTSTGSTDTYETDNVLQTISAELGDAHKVRSFYNNIVNPASVDGHVTMDTHAVAALLAKALSGAMAEVSHNFGTSLVGSSKVNGVSGLYAANAEAYRGIAADFDLLARELQSITWESVRILFPPEFKRLKQATDDLNAVWDSFARETPYTPVTVKGQPTPPTIALETLDDVWEQIIRVVWSHTRKGKPVPSLAELRSSAEIDNLPNGTTRRYEDYNGLGFPAWDTRRESMRLLLTEQDKAKETLDDVVEDFLDVSGYLNNPDTLNSSFGQEEGGTNMLSRLFKADQNPPVFYSTATIQRAIQNVSTDIVGETTEEILSQALRAKVILASYGYEGFAETIRNPEVTTLSAYFELKSAKTSTTDPRNGGENGLTYKDAFEPEFMRFFRNAPVLRETIKRNQTGFTLSGDVESQLEGFVVSPRKSTEKFLTEDFTDDELRQYIVDHADILSLPGARLGGWYDPSTQRFTLDVSFALTEREDAITIALASDQDAIYDLQNRYDIRTKYTDPDTGESSFVVTRIDGRDPQQVIGEVVPTTGDAAIFASERSVRDKGRMGFASDGGSEAGGAGVTDVGTSRALSEAMEINRAARSGQSTQGNFGTVEPLTERTASPSTFRTGRFKSIDEKSFRDKLGPINDRGAEHRVWFDQKASNRVFKYAYKFGLTKAINAPNIQAGYVARVAASNILFEDKQRIEYMVHHSGAPQAPAVGYVISQPFLDSKNRRKMEQEEINATMEALGWRLFRPEGAVASTIFSSPSIQLPEGGTARIFVYDLHTENAYAETVTDEDGNVVEKFVVLDAPIGIRFPRGTSQEVIDRYPTVAELLAEFPDPASFGIAVPSMLPEIKRAEAASKLFDAIAFSEESSDTLLSQFGNAQDAEYLALAADPVKNQARLQEMVNWAGENAGFMLTNRYDYDGETGYLPWLHGSRTQDIKVFKATGDFFFFTDEEFTAESFGGVTYRSLLRIGNALNVDAEGADKYSISFEGKDYNVEDLMFLAKDRGYDSVVIENVVDNAGGSPDTATVAVVFNSNQIKSADPVTYDESGNVIPLSQRFDSTSDDTRYSQFGNAQDSAYLSAVESGDMEAATEATPQDVLTGATFYSSVQYAEDSQPVKFYRGRPKYYVGNLADPERQDYGPGAYYTDDIRAAQYFSFREDAEDFTGVSAYNVGGNLFRLDTLKFDSPELREIVESFGQEYKSDEWKTIILNSNPYTRLSAMAGSRVVFSEKLKELGYDGMVSGFGISGLSANAKQVVLFNESVANQTSLPDGFQGADSVMFADKKTSSKQDADGNVIPLSQRFDTTSDDIRFSQFGFRDSGATLLDQRMGTISPDNQSMFNDMFDVLEIPILASGTYQKPDSFFARLAMGEFDPRYRKMLQTQRAFNVSAASYIEQERKALTEEVEKAYGSSKDVGANLLISRAFGSTDVTLPEETVAKLRKERRDKLIAAQAAATPEAVEAYVANLMAMDSTMDPLDADIRAKNEIRDAAIKQAKDESEADDIAARQVHRDMVVKAQNSAIRSLERQAPEVLKRVKRIRLFVDEQSRRIKAELKDNSDLRVIIDNQLGIYVTRSYRFFSDEGYRDAIRNPENKNYSTYEAERQLARAFFEEQYIEDRTIELMEAEFGLDEDGAKAKAQEEVDGRAADGRRIGEEMMIRWLDSLEGKAPITEATTSPQGKDDLTIRIVANNLKQRKSVPEPLRKLLNEMDEAEGIERMLRTAATVSAIHSNQKTLSNIYKFGRSDKAPENRWLLTKKEIDALPYEEQRGYSMVPSKGSAGVSAVNPLVGMYAPNDLVEALNNLSTKQHIDSQTAASQQTINAMMMSMTQATGVSMAVNVLLSVGHYFRNVLGYTAVAAVTGRPSLMYKSMSSLSRESKFLLPERLRKALDMTDEKYNVERLRLVALNIDNDSVRASTLKDMLSGKTSMEDVQKEIMSLADAAKTATGKALGVIGDSLTQLEQATETFFKIAYFYDTLEMLDNAVAEGTGTINGLPVSAFNNETALYQEAARQTLMVLPSHSQTMPIVTEFTKSGFGLMLAPFLRFKSEMIRTPINNMKLAMEEINSGNSVLRARGIARLTGSFVVLTASTALPMLISKVLGGLDDEDDEALRKSMPSYLRDHSFFYFMFNGELKSIDLTYVNPYSGIGDAFNAMYRAAVKGDVLAPAKGVAQFFSQNFLDDQILFGALRAATENRDPTTGLPIYEAGLDTPSEAAIKMFKFVGLEAYGPRVLTDTLKVIEAAKEGETSPGYGVSDIMLNGVMPFRIHTIDPDQQFRRYLFEHRQQYQRAEGGLNELLGRKAIGPDRVEDIYDETVKNKKRANEDLLRTALAFTGEGLGVSSADADTMMRASGVSKTRISQLNNRAMDRAIPSKDFVDKLLDTPEGKARGQILYDYILQQPRYYELDVR